MRRIGLAVLLAISLLLAPLAAEAQQAGKVSRIGYILVGTPASTWKSDPHWLAFVQTLRELGWVEGRNIAVEFRSAEGQFERLPAVATDLARLKVDLIVVRYTRAALAAKQATTTIPIVMTAVSDPIGMGLIASLARPGGNVTGLTTAAADLAQKRLELLKEMVPHLSRVAVLGVTVQVRHWSEAQAAAQALGLTLLPVEVQPSEGYEGAFAKMAQARTQALEVFGDPFGPQENVRRFLALAAKHRLSAIYSGRRLVEASGLMSYAPDEVDSWRRAATYVDKILKGAKPADLPVEQPTKFELVINLKTAKALGLTIPQPLLLRADQVID